VNKQDLIKFIEEKGWKKIRQDSDFLGYRFQIIGEKRFWHILFAFTDNLNKGNIEEFKKIFVDISKKSRRWFLGKCFLFCVIADRIDPQVAEDVRKDSFRSLRLSFDTKRDYFIFFFLMILSYILPGMFAIFLIYKRMDWSMVYALSYGALPGAVLTVGLASERGLKGGGGNIFLLDLNEKKIYGEVPTIPLYLHKYSKEMNEILQKIT
jgi:hypothetical protein